MKILFLGDVVGRSGRDAVLKHLPALKTALKPDFTIVNGENAAAGFGLTDKIATDLYGAGAECITTGNHVWDQKELLGTIDRDPKILRPINYPVGTPGRGHVVLSSAQGKKLLVVNAMARLFMDAMDDPFAAMEKLLAEYKIGQTIDAVFLDFHGEASSEKMSMAHFLDGRVTAVIGTHTHVPTADAQIFPGGTAYMTDAGMCGDYDSVIGMKKETAIARFTRKIPLERLAPADGEATVCGALVRVNAAGLAQAIEPIRIGPRLQNTATSAP